MKGYVCKVCGLRSLTGEAPDNCPNCGVPKENFDELENAIMEPGTDVGESEKKHLPSIKVSKECGLIPEGCQDALIRIGEILHPMTPEHSILWADVYVNKEFVARMRFTPKVNPSVIVHLKPELSGKLQVVELCNVHGAWLSEVDL